MSEHEDGDGGAAVEEDPNPLQRALDLLVFAPVGVALTVVEDLPALIGKGRQRFESDLQNARFVGRFFVNHAQHQLVERVGKLLHGEGSDGSENADSATGSAESTASGSTTTGGPRTVAPGMWTTPSSKLEADPADGAIVEAALAGYDTLSASQVVRRLESLGPEELRALHRHEASHRNRRTILNRAHQILEATEAGGVPASSSAAFATTPPEAVAPEAVSGEAVSPEDAAPEAVSAQNTEPEDASTATVPPPEADTPGPDRLGE